MLSSSPALSVPHPKKKTTQKKEKKDKKKGEKGGESIESNEAIRKTHKISKKELWKIYDSEQETPSKHVLEIQSTAPFTKPKPLLSSSLPLSHSQFQTTEKEDPSTEEADLCSHCQQGVIQWSDENIPICSSCGVMYHEQWVDPSPEWKFFKSDEKNHGNNPTRCGNPINPLLEESSIGCKITLPSHASTEMRRIKRWMDWQLMPYNEKALYDAFQYITTMSQLAGIAKTIIDRACWWYREFSLHEQHRGVKLTALKAASLDMASREFNCPRTPFEIAEIFKMDKKDAAKGCSIAEDIRNHMARTSSHQHPSHPQQPQPQNKSESNIPTDNSIAPLSSIPTPTTATSAPEVYEELFSVSPSSFMERYCSKLNINQELTVLSRFIAQKIEKENLITDNMPHAISAGIVFFIAVNCNLPISKTDIKQISGISEVTINKCYKKINHFRIHLLPKCIVQKYKTEVSV
jgi:transcription initiation factor TFIIB